METIKRNYLYMQSSLVEIYNSLLAYGGAILERTIALYSLPVGEEPDIVLAIICDKSKKCKTGIISIINNNILNYLDDHTKDRILKYNNREIPLRRLREILETLDRILNIEVFRIVTNVGREEILSEIVMAVYTPKK